jgi:N-acetylmuramoyl-L-alanine amidase
MLTGIKRQHIIFGLLLWGVSLLANSANSINGIRLWPAPENTRIVFDLASKPQYSYFSLQSPQRLVIDFKDTRNKVGLDKLAQTGQRVIRLRKVALKTSRIFAWF